MNGIEILRMPANLPAGFASGFVNLASLSGALPISHFEIARIGFDAEPAPPRPPILAIDGSARPATAPGIPREHDAPVPASGYEADWNLLQDLMDLPPSATEGSEIDPMDMVLARDAGWFDFGSLREIIADSGLPPSAYNFFARAFGSAAADTISLDHSGAHARDTEPEKDFMEYAASRFLEGVFLAKASRIERQAAVELALVQSAMGFALSDRYSAAAMMLDHSVSIQMNSGMPFSQTMTEQAKMWLAELHRGDPGSFEVVYPRALNAAQHDHPGSGLLEPIFEVSAGHYIAVEDFAEAARALVRKSWARMMMLEIEAGPGFSPEDWTVVAGSLAVAADSFARTGLDAFSSMAESLVTEASSIKQAGTDLPRIEIISSRPPRPEEHTLSLRKPPSE